MSLLILIFIFIFILYKKYNSKIIINNKTFSNTDHWGKNELTVLNNITTHGKNLLKQTCIYIYKSSDSITFKKDYALLYDKQKTIDNIVINKKT